MEAITRWARPLLALSLVLSVGAACSKKSPEPAAQEAPAPQAPNPYDVRVSAAEVAAGLGQIDQAAKGVAEKTGTDQAGAEQLNAQIHPAWEAIEGTIKSNDQESYITFEDNFALLSNAAKEGDAAKAKASSETISKAVADYLAKFPA